MLPFAGGARNSADMAPPTWLDITHEPASGGL